MALNDSGRLGEDRALGELLGRDRWAEETTLGEWLYGQNEAGLRVPLDQVTIGPVGAIVRIRVQHPNRFSN